MKKSVKPIVKYLTASFFEKYSYIECFSKEVEEAAARVVDYPEEMALDLMRDYILSQGKGDVVE